MKKSALIMATLMCFTGTACHWNDFKKRSLKRQTNTSTVQANTSTDIDTGTAANNIEQATKSSKGAVTSISVATGVVVLGVVANGETSNNVGSVTSTSTSTK